MTINSELFIGKSQRPNSLIHYPYALLGTFKNIQWEDTLNVHFQKGSHDIYWLPWGNRQRNLKKLLLFYSDKNLLKVEKRSQIMNGVPTLFTSYHVMEERFFPIKFFHHRSKDQGGDGKILYCYNISCVLISETSISPKSSLMQDLIEFKSPTWFGLSGKGLATTQGKPLDFSADFDIIDDLDTAKKHQFHETQDSKLLYYDLAIVQHFSHKRNSSACRCPQCKA